MTLDGYVEPAASSLLPPQMVVYEGERGKDDNGLTIDMLVNFHRRPSRRRGRTRVGAALCGWHVCGAVRLTRALVAGGTC